MAPIRIGFIGLSTKGWARTAHSPYLKDSPNYQIVAICNSTVESSDRAIKEYKLLESTKAYGNPEDIAKDPNVDLVVCSVRVDQHFATISPSLKAGKNVYVEWPLGSNLAEAEQLLLLKKEGGVKTAVVGLQARQAPSVKKLKQLVDSGRIGEVLNSTWVGQATNLGETTMPHLEYLGNRELGGNMVTIHFGHAIDYVQQVLGYGFESPPKTLLANRRKTVKLLDSDGNIINANHPKTADDTIFLNGTLSSGIPLSFSLRGGKPFKDTPGLEWRIYGSAGEIRVTSAGPFLQIGYPDLKIQVYVTGDGKDELEEVVLDKDGLDDEKYPLPARNVGRIYESLVEGKNNCTFEDAVERHRLIETMYKENVI